MAPGRLEHGSKSAVAGITAGAHRERRRHRERHADAQCPRKPAFGGVGESGWGSYHGEAGFATDAAKAGAGAVEVGAGDWFYPPYGKRFEQIMGLLKRLI